jgi:excisionase family DNA binding protein
MSSATSAAAPTELAFTSSQAATYLGVSLATVRRWSNTGHLHGYRTPGGQRRFSRDQLETFLDSLSGASGAQRQSPEMLDTKRG